jgi:hypothetical protein
VTRPFLIAMLTASTFAMNIAATAGELPSDWEDRIKLGVRAYDKGEHRVAFDTFYKLMAEGIRRYGAADGRLVRLYSNMGEVYSEENQFKYGEDLLKKGLNIAQKGYGENSIQAVPAMINLGQCYVRQGKDSLAKPLFDKALAIVDKPDDEKLVPYAAVIETNLGAMYFAQGKYAFGEPHFKRALELAQKSFGPDHKWTTTIGAMYATCLSSGGKKAEAKAVERAARAKANEAQSPIAKWNRKMEIANEAIKNKNYAEAEAALKLALQAAQDASTEPMLQALTLDRYGQLFVAENKPALAIDKWKAAQAIADASLGLEDDAVMKHAKQLADLQKQQNQYREAEPLYVRLVAYAKKQNGAESDEYANSLSDIAELYSAWAQYPKAVTYYQKLLAFQEKKFGADSEKLIPTLVALGDVAQNNTKYFTEVNDKAEDHLKRAVEIATKHHGKNSKEVANVHDVLSRYYQRHFDWEKATKMCSLVVASDEKNFGPDSPETMKALEHYAVVLRAAGLRNEAENVEARIAKVKSSKAAPTDD